MLGPDAPIRGPELDTSTKVIWKIDVPGGCLTAADWRSRYLWEPDTFSGLFYTVQCLRLTLFFPSPSTVATQPMVSCRKPEPGQSGAEEQNTRVLLSHVRKKKKTSRCDLCVCHLVSQPLPRVDFALDENATGMNRHAAFHLSQALHTTLCSAQSIKSSPVYFSRRYSSDWPSSW